MSRDGGLRTLFRQRMPEAHWQAVELGGVGRGVPDVNYCHPPGIEGWVEFKETETYSVPLRPEQVAWISRRARAGGRVHVAVRRKHEGGPRKGPPCDELWLCPGSEVLALAEGGLLAVPSILVWTGGPRRWDWGEVRAALVGEQVQRHGGPGHEAEGHREHHDDQGVLPPD